MVAFEPYQALHETGMLTTFPYVSTYEYLLAFDEPEFVRADDCDDTLESNVGCNKDCL